MTCLTCMLIGAASGVMVGLVGPILVRKLKEIVERKL